MNQKAKRLLLAGMILICLAVGAMLFFTRPKLQIDGERISDPGRFALHFDRMNGSDSETLVLQAGEALHVSWQIESGNVDVRIAAKGKEAIYQADDRPAGDKADFYVEIPRTGAYAITVSARDARGWLEFVTTESN